MPRLVASFLVILAVLPITVVPTTAIAAPAADRIEPASLAHHRLDVFGLAEAPRAEAAQTPRPTIVLALRLPSLQTSAERGATLRARPADQRRRDGVRRRCPERRARTGPDDPAH